MPASLIFSLNSAMILTGAAGPHIYNFQSDSCETVGQELGSFRMGNP